MTSSIFTQVLAVFIMILAGIVARKKNILDEAGTKQIAGILVNFFYPALIFSSMTKNFTVASLTANWMLPSGTLLIMTVGYIIGWTLTCVLSFNDGRERAIFHFQCTINNYVFLPMPLILLLFGESGVACLVLSTLGAEIAVWTIGLLALNGNQIGWTDVKKFFSMPIIAIMTALFVIAVRDLMPALTLQLFEPCATNAFMTALTMLGGGTIPLAMLIAGSRMATLQSKHLMTFRQMIVIVMRLGAIPLITVTLLYMLPFTQETREILVVIAVMPVSIASVTLSEVYRCDASFAAGSVLLTHLFALLTIPCWLFWLWA